MGSTTLSSLANRVRALKRKLHRPYTEYFVGHEVNQLCEEWTDAQSQNKPLPDPHDFIRKVADCGFHLPILHRRLRLPGLLPTPQKRARPQAPPRRPPTLASIPLSLLIQTNPKNVPESPQKSQHLKNLPPRLSLCHPERSEGSKIPAQHTPQPSPTPSPFVLSHVEGPTDGRTKHPPPLEGSPLNHHYLPRIPRKITEKPHPKLTQH